MGQAVGGGGNYHTTSGKSGREDGDGPYKTRHTSFQDVLFAFG